ncbi:extracellular solute-binding protein [Azospirillum sp. ST 5-10]|uniref:extracellular solute-binding protein n=1 Tax=unclassified Azospirillum TaxID=2630922 RepID=UPI003F4A3986
MRHFRRAVPALLALFLFSAAAAAAEPRHGIAMHGEPKYPPGFDHFDYVNPDAPKGGTLRQAALGTFDTLNPHVVKGVPARWPGSPFETAGGVFETLLARAWDEPFSLYGLLAESVAVPDDRSSATFVIRPEARWPDGAPVTADDVLFSFAAQRRHGTPNRRLFYGKAQAERLGDRVVRFTFQPLPDGTADREMPLLMGLMPIHQKAWWAGRDFAATTLDPPPGSGPYRIAAVDPGRRIVYERRPDYWGAALAVRRGLFNPDRIEVDYYRDDRVALEAFKAGNLDLRREGDPGTWATGYAGPALQRGAIVLEAFHHGRPDVARGFIFNTRRPPFDDVRVRTALGHAGDFAWINRTLFHGALERSPSYYPNSELAAAGLPGADERAVLEPFRDRLPPDLFTRPFRLPESDGSGPYANRDDRRAALRLLADAGWRLDGGRLVDAAGTPFAFEILLGDPSDERVALEYARGLERLGIQATVRTVDSAQFQGRLDRFDFDVTVRWWASSLSPGNEQLYYFGSAAADQPGSRNYPGIRDPVVDAVAGSIAQARTREELVARARALDRVLMWGHYRVPLFHAAADRIARWTRVGRPEVTPLYGPVVEAWWVR